jgi:hypothetical protein
LKTLKAGDDLDLTLANGARDSSSPKWCSTLRPHFLIDSSTALTGRAVRFSW